jgi:NAD(P)H-flavin reductase
MTQTTAGAASAGAAGATVPRRFVVTTNRPDTRDTRTLGLEPLDGPPLAFEPGQFTMVSAVGYGEVPISISGDPGRPDVLQHTIRDVGSASHGLVAAPAGSTLTIRGPYGTGWEVGGGRGGDVVVMAGGIGLAPLRPAVLEVCAHRDEYADVSLLYGARTPEELLFPDDLARWAADHDIDVQVTVDSATGSWPGRVGLVTSLVERAGFAPDRTLALVCGPEVMMRHSARALLDHGIAPERVRVSMERNMKCGIGLCGHCQLRELFICLDGPVLSYDRLAPLMSEAEL